jgi:hypothetical protein
MSSSISSSCACRHDNDNNNNNNNIRPAALQLNGSQNNPYNVASPFPSSFPSPASAKASSSSKASSSQVNAQQKINQRREKRKRYPRSYESAERIQKKKLWQEKRNRRLSAMANELNVRSRTKMEAYIKQWKKEMIDDIGEPTIDDMRHMLSVLEERKSGGNNVADDIALATLTTEVAVADTIAAETLVSFQSNQLMNER